MTIKKNDKYDNSFAVDVAKIDPNLNGPESIPLRDFVKSFPLTVTIYDAKGLIVRKETIDYGNFEHRKWLGRVTFWACSNNYMVETAKAK